MAKCTKGGDMLAFGIVTIVILGFTIIFLTYIGFKESNATAAAFICPLAISTVFASLALAGITIVPLGVLSIIFMILLILFLIIMIFWAAAYDSSDVAMGGIILLCVSTNTIVYLGCVL